MTPQSAIQRDYTTMNIETYIWNKVNRQMAGARFGEGGSISGAIADGVMSVNLYRTRLSALLNQPHKKPPESP
jgi:hypothetical protein